MQKLVWLLAGAVGLTILTAAAGLILLWARVDGFSAKSRPSALEELAARTARRIALPRGATQKQNPVPNSAEVLAEARAHWADHCAMCHGNDGSGQTDIGRHMYPPAPNMRQGPTQQMTDGELFYIIENGIRLSGMPAWGSGTDQDAQDSWKLVHFIRHLPSVSSDEIKEMEKLNPKSPEELEEEKLEEQFLKGETPVHAPKEHSHH